MTPVKIIRLVTWALVLVLGLGTGYVLWQAQNKPAAVAGGTGEAAIGGPFALTDMNGQPVTEAILKGRAHAMFFGFTHCPDVCPTTLGDLTVMLGELGPAGDKIDVYFVTVDPERDTAPIIKDYLSAFSPKFVGLTGNEQAIADMTATYRVYRRKVPLDGGDYTMDHSAAVFLFDDTGAFRGTLSSSDKKEDQLEKLKRLAGA